MLFFGGGNLQFTCAVNSPGFRRDRGGGRAPSSGSRTRRIGRPPRTARCSRRSRCTRRIDPLRR
jgi:hypothetical protein